ncbi:MAG: hypothetical protein AAFV95_04450 [Bacteroidota bacterium]
MKSSFIAVIALATVAALSACSGTKNSSSSMSNLVATLQIDEPIEGLCDPSNVIAILPIPGNGQVEAKAPLSEEEIAKQVNASAPFLQANPNYKDKGMIGLIVNCKGKLVKCEMDNKTKSPELDQQIVDVFSKLENWEAGSLAGKPIDTSVLYSFQIKNGTFSFEQ